ncbi:MAG: InlB B-repeat-containing protein, partial [Deferrisomatales bacterium]
MKRSAKCAAVVMLVVVGLLAGAGAALARTATLAWDPNPPAENVTGYVVHYGTQSRAAPGFVKYGAEVDVGNVTQYAVTFPDPSAVYYLAVVAYNQLGLRSDYSAEVVSAPPAPATYTVAASAGAGGAISPSGSVTVSHGGSQTFAITASAGYQVADVKVDGVSVGAVTSHTIANVTANRTIAATFSA